MNPNATVWRADMDALSNPVAPVRNCSKCDVPAVHDANGAKYCSKHWRFLNMRVSAKSDAKTVPSYQELESLLPADMHCPVCKRQMNWLARDGRSTQITLQHDRDGRHRLICGGCNSRHAQLPGDLLYTIKDDERWCNACKTIKPVTDFHRDNGASRVIRLMSKCKICSRAQYVAWVARNREYVREKNIAYQREYRAKNLAAKLELAKAREAMSDSERDRMEELKRCYNTWEN